MIKKKKNKCKGTGKAAGNGCGELVFRHRYGLCRSCFAYWLYNTPEGMEQVHKAVLKVIEPRKSLEKAERTHKERKSITTYLNSTKQAVHEMVRLRDSGKPCISCGVPYDKNFQAGHCYGANNYRSIKFDFRNINGQCQKCNLFLNGNESAYILNLPARIGQNEFNDLKRLAETSNATVKHWTKEELKEIRTKAKAIIKQLKQ